MSGPGGQQLRERDDSEGGMASAPSEIFRPQIQCAEFGQAVAPHARKFIQQLPERLTFALSRLSPTVEGLERARLAKLQNHFRARHPVGAVTVNQMANDIEGAPGVFTFISQRPRFRQIAQKRVESGGSSSEKRYCVLEVLCHQAPPFVDNDFPKALILSRVG